MLTASSRHLAEPSVGSMVCEDLGRGKGCDTAKGRSPGLHWLSQHGYRHPLPGWWKASGPAAGSPVSLADTLQLKPLTRPESSQLPTLEQHRR